MKLKNEIYNCSFIIFDPVKICNIYYYHKSQFFHQIGVRIPNNIVHFIVNSAYIVTSNLSFREICDWSLTRMNNKKGSEVRR